MGESSSITCQEVIDFAENYAYLSGKNFKKMANLEPVKGNSVCNQLRMDLNQLLEDQTLIDSELKTITANQERATALLKEFGFS